MSSRRLLSDVYKTRTLLLVVVALFRLSLSLSLLMSSRRLLSDVYKTRSLLLVVVALFLGNCCAKTSPNCVSSCGNIHNISHPFRLKGDPENRRNKKYELECEHDRLVLNLFSSGNYYVHAINYNNYTILLVDVGLQQGNCSSLPLYSLSDLNFTGYYDAAPYSLQDFDFVGSSDRIQWNISVALWLDCEKPVKNSPLYMGLGTKTSCIENATSSSSSSPSSGEKRHYSYFLFGTDLRVSDVANQCEVDDIIMTTLRLPAYKSEANISFSDFHDKLEYGFELSWLSFLCEQCPEQLANCEIGSNYVATTTIHYQETGPFDVAWRFFSMGTSFRGSKSQDGSY